MKILFVTANRLGDAVLSTGLLAHLIESHPGAEFTIAAGPMAAPLFGAVPRLERLIVFEKRSSGRHWFDLWRGCVARRWDMVVDLRRSILGWLLLARERYAIPKIDGPLHRVQLAAATMGIEDEPPSPVLWTGPEDAAEATRLVPKGGPVLAIAPAANWRGKEWRSENFAAAVGRLTAADSPLPDARVAVLAAPDERPQAEAVLAAIPDQRRIDLIGGPALPVVAACLRRCALFIGNDSGLMHMAAASGIPTLGLFGPSRPEHYAPWGPNGAFVRTELSYDELVGAPGYDHLTTDTLMDSLSVDMVEEAARELWRRAARDAA